MAMMISWGCAGESLPSVLGELPGSVVLPPTICAFHLGFSLAAMPAGQPWLFALLTG